MEKASASEEGAVGELATAILNLYAEHKKRWDMHGLPMDVEIPPELGIPWKELLPELKSLLKGYLVTFDTPGGDHKIQVIDRADIPNSSKEGCEGRLPLAEHMKPEPPLWQFL